MCERKRKRERHTCEWDGIIHAGAAEKKGPACMLAASFVVVVQQECPYSTRKKARKKVFVRAKVPSLFHTAAASSSNELRLAAKSRVTTVWVVVCLCVCLVRAVSVSSRVDSSHFLLSQSLTNVLLYPK